MKKILIIQTASIGDVILATSLTENLHQSFPDASIDFLLKKGNESLFNGHPFLNQVITWDKRAGKIKGLFQIIRQVRKARYDLVVNIQRFFLTGLLTVLSGSPDKRGFSKNPFACLFTRKIKHQIGTSIHETERNHSLISDLTTSAPMRPRLYPTTADKQAISQYASGTFYTISPASLWPTKQFPSHKWAELTGKIPGEATVFLLGSTGDLALCNEIAASAGREKVINLAGKLSFTESAALMKMARMNFTNDSAPMHLASAVNATVTAVFCSTVPEFGFGPLSDKSSIVEIMSPLACRPCGLHGYAACPEKHFKCAELIDISQLTAYL
jgi:heptosyltransferase-2